GAEPHIAHLPGVRDSAGGRVHRVAGNALLHALSLDVLREYRYWSRSSQAPRAFEDGRILHCPLCKHEMDHHPYGGGGNLAVDSCESCGVLWLDRGELSRVLAAPGRDPPEIYRGPHRT